MSSRKRTKTQERIQATADCVIGSSRHASYARAVRPAARALSYSAFRCAPVRGVLVGAGAEVVLEADEELSEVGEEARGVDHVCSGSLRPDLGGVRR